MTAADRMREYKRRVALMVADQMAPRDIAAVLNMPLEKLEAVFRRELDHGHSITRAEALFRLEEKAAGGSVSADRALVNLTAVPAEPGTPKPPTTVPLGKKELRQRAAENAGVDSEWGSDLVAPSADVVPETLQ